MVCTVSDFEGFLHPLHTNNLGAIVDSVPNGIKISALVHPLQVTISRL